MGVCHFGHKTILLKIDDCCILSNEFQFQFGFVPEKRHSALSGPKVLLGLYIFFRGTSFVKFQQYVWHGQEVLMLFSFLKRGSQLVVIAFRWFGLFQDVALMKFLDVKALSILQSSGHQMQARCS